MPYPPHVLSNSSWNSKATTMSIPDMDKRSLAPAIRHTIVVRMLINLEVLRSTLKFDAHHVRIRIRMYYFSTESHRQLKVTKFLLTLFANCAISKIHDW